MNWKTALEPVVAWIPSVESPSGHTSFSKKMWWTVGVLSLYFFLTNISLVGLGTGGNDLFGQFRSLLAGGQGTILQLGIGPIVTASIILQILTGADLLGIDQNDPRDKALYQGLQKILVFVMVVVQAVPIVFASGYLPADAALGQTLGVGIVGVQLLLFIQVVAGGIIIFYLDALVSKWGIGSGVGLFIIAGISQRLLGGLIGIPGVIGTQWGIIPTWGRFVTGDIEFTISSLLYGPGGLLALITTVGIFATVVYAESVKVEIPLSHQRMSSARGKYPVKLIYASVLPIILVSALQANIQILGRVLHSTLGDSLPVWIGDYSNGQPVEGVFWYLSPIRDPSQWMWWTSAPAGTVGEVLLHLAVYTVFMVGLSAVFAIFWVQTADMGPETVAKQIQQSGMQIPGFRNNQRSFERVLNRYIPHVTILGGALVGLLAVVANLLGTIGGVSGTGLLLTVSITYKLYEEIAEEKIKDIHPVMGQLIE